MKLYLILCGITLQKRKAKRDIKDLRETKDCKKKCDDVDVECLKDCEKAVKKLEKGEFV